MAVSSDWCWYKDQDWDYEHEWRCVRKIRAGEPRDIPFSPEDIVEVINGSQTSDSNINAILNFCEALRITTADSNPTDAPEPLVLQLAKPDISSRTIRLDPCQWFVCPQCSGCGHMTSEAHFTTT